MSIYRIPQIPLNEPITNPQDGTLTFGWSRTFDSIAALLTNNFNEQGLHLPTISTDDLGNTDAGVMWYDADLDLPRVLIDGVDNNILTAPTSDVTLIVKKVDAVASVIDPEEGQPVYESSTQLMKYYNGTIWVTM